MTITNAAISQAVTDLLNKWLGWQEELKNWLNGVVSGGPASDGKYPLTDYLGNTSHVECPAKMADTVNGLTASALSHKDDAEAASASAQASASTASTHANTALTHKNNAEGARDIASTHASTASNAANNASAAASAIDAKITVSEDAPSGGSDGDIWYVVTP